MRKTCLEIHSRNKYLREHDLSPIPENILNNIHKIHPSQVAVNRDEVPTDTHEEFFKNLKKSEWIKGISPIYRKEYPRFIDELIDEGKDIELVLTDNVIDIMDEKVPEHLDRFFEYDGLSLYMCSADMRLASGVGEGFVSVSLFFENGKFDPSTDLISKHKSGEEWGKKLFNYWKGKSKEITRY